MISKRGSPEKKAKVIYLHEGWKPIVDDATGGPATKKIRMIIQKHFMTGFPHSLKEKKTLNFDFMMLQ